MYTIKTVLKYTKVDLLVWMPFSHTPIAFCYYCCYGAFSTLAPPTVVYIESQCKAVLEHVTQGHRHRLLRSDIFLYCYFNVRKLHTVALMIDRLSNSGSEESLQVFHVCYWTVWLSAAALAVSLITANSHVTSPCLQTFHRHFLFLRYLPVFLYI